MTANQGRNNHTLQWSVSATGMDAHPVSSNLTWAAPDADEQTGLEHRIDWRSDRAVSLSNSGTNASANAVTYVKEVNATNLPSSPAPVSFWTWSNGEPSASQGPPILAPAITHILYTRFFFNSTLAERQLQFGQQCQAAPADAVCSTDDYTLRDSTPYTPAATVDFPPAPQVFHPPLYAIVAESAALGLLLLLALHVLVTRRLRRSLYKPPPATHSQREDSQGSLTDKDSTLAGTEGASVVDLAETLILAKSMSRAQSLRGSRRNSSVGHGSSLGHAKGNGSRQSLAHYASSRPPSFVQTRRPRDITDLDNLFDGWETDSGYDSDEFAQANRISGNFERYDDDDGDWQGGDNHHEVEILPRTVAVRPQREESSSSEIKPSTPPPPPPPPQIVQWQMRGEGAGAPSGAGGQLAKPVAEADARDVARDNTKSALTHYPTLLQLALRRVDRFLFVERTQVLTSTGQRRIDYLDGMRGMACLFVSLAHFSLIFFIGIANPGAPNHYYQFEFWYRALFGAITNNASLLLGTFFALPARTMCQRYLLKGGLGSMADATVRRIPRLMLPVTGAALINYFLMDVNGFKWVRRLASRTWSVWSYWQMYDNALVFANAVLTLCWGAPPEQPALVTGYATGVLWTIPVIVQGMWTCMIASLVAHEIKSTWKRYSFYFLAVLFSWYANTWDCFFVVGLIVGDMDSKLRYREAAARGFPVPIPALRGKHRWVHVHGKILAWLFFFACCVQQWLTYVRGAPGGNFSNIEHSVHPDWQTARPQAWYGAIAWSGYTNPAITGFFLILAVFIIVDMSEWMQKFFRLRIWHWLGLHSMAVYLLHGIVWWTWGAWLFLTLLKAGAPYWAAALATLITGYMLLFTMCICFTATFEVWATLLAKAVWRATSGNMGRKV